MDREKVRADIQERLDIAKEFRDEEQEVQTRAYLDGQVYVLGRIISDLDFGLWASEQSAAKQQAEIERLREALRVYEPICSNCWCVEDEHDENGEVDLVDEIGHKICGNPTYSAKAALQPPIQGDAV